MSTLRTSCQVDAETDAHQRAREVSRRMFLKSSLTGAAALGAAGQLQAGAQSQSAGSGSPITPQRHDPLLTLVHHVTQGFTEASFAESQGLGYEAWLEWQLAPELIDDSSLDARLAGLPSLAMTAQELFQNYIQTGNPNQPLIELKTAVVLRSALSRRQLYERMVEFWTDHFNILHNNGLDTILKTVDDREVVRTHALGRFEDLLRASAKSSAMSFYLNNDTNTVDSINENYAREIMELHTLGVNGSYNEHDVTELARCFTGWAYYPVGHPLFGEFAFYPARHDNGEKILLGETIAAGGGIQDGETMITFLAGHADTAEYLCKKLIQWLLGYAPSQDMVDEAAAVFSATGGEIKDVLRVILARRNIAKVPLGSQPKLRRPFHFVISALRAPGATINAVGDLLTIHLRTLGHTPYDWVSPDGYPDNVDAWGSGVLPRWQFASALFSNQIPGIALSNQQLFALVQGTPQEELAARIDQVLTGGTLAQSDLQELQDYIDSFANLSANLVRESFALAASSPSFQLY